MEIVHGRRARCGSTATHTLASVRRNCSGDSGAVIERMYLSGARSVTSESVSMAIAAGGSTVERIPKRRTSSAKASGSKRSMITSAAPARSPNRAL